MQTVLALALLLSNAHAHVHPRAVFNTHVGARSRSRDAHANVAWSYSPALPKRVRAARAAFEKNGGVLYLPNFLEPDEFESIRLECRRLRSKAKHEKDSIAVGRLGRILTPKTASFKAFMSEAMASRLNELTGLEGLRPSDYAVEVRYYPIGACMEWHRDDQLFEPAQLEVVFTLENSSDSNTQWLTSSGELESIWTEPNSIIAVTAGADGPMHRVTPIKRGERSILKLVYCRSDKKTAQYDTHLDSFPGRKREKAKKASNGRRR